MPDPTTTALKLVEGFEELFAGTNAYRADVIAKIGDALIGNDRTALLKDAPGLTPDMLEAVSDFVFNQLAAQVKKRLDDTTTPELPPTPPTPA